MNFLSMRIFFKPFLELIVFTITMLANKLPDSFDELKQIITSLSETITYKDIEISNRDREIEILREELRLERMRQFAARSEKLPAGNQTCLFDEAEIESAKPDEDTLADAIEVPSHKRVRGKRKPLPDSLPREDVVIDLSEQEKICAKDGSALKEIGSDVSEKLDVVPAQIKVIRTIRKKYICPCCNDQANIKTAPMPESILPKSNATAGLLSYISTSKYVDALPLYRIEDIFKRHGIEIPRNTMARWMIEMSEKLIPVYNMLEDDLLGSDYISCDETTVQVLNEAGKSAESKSYMWVRCRHGTGVSPIVLFEYDPTRSKTVPNRLLDGFSGYLQVDGYAGYDEFCGREGVIRVGCMAHVRRKFVDVYKASGKKSGSADWVLKRIQALYKIENEMADKPVNDRHATRQAQSKPILDEIKSWLDGNQAKHPPSGLMGKAITYAQNQWQYILNHLKDGRLAIDNNFTENRIRPFALGRKNWLFSDSVNGVKASAMIYSILQSARANGLEPYAYMRHLLTELPKCKIPQEIERLLPHRINCSIFN